MPISDFPLSFLLPLLVHSLAGLATCITGIVAFSLPKRKKQHPQWGKCYLWAYTLVFLTATILTVQRWETDAYLFFLAIIGYGFALLSSLARRFRQKPWMRQFLGKQWIIAHIVGMIASYVILWTAFYVDNAHLIPLLNTLPVLTFWVLPTLIALPFLAWSLSRFMPYTKTHVREDHASKGKAYEEERTVV